MQRTPFPTWTKAPEKGSRRKETPLSASCSEIAVAASPEMMRSRVFSRLEAGVTSMVPTDPTDPIAASADNETKPKNTTVRVFFMFSPNLARRKRCALRLLTKHDQSRNRASNKALPTQTTRVRRRTSRIVLRIFPRTAPANPAPLRCGGAGCTSRCGRCGRAIRS